MAAAADFPGVVLVGFMGSGKSSVGKELARRTGAEFVDVDSWIERNTGREIRALFAEEGEAVFREMERNILKDVFAVKGRVVAAGGGAFLDEENRKAMKAYAPVVYLETEAGTLLRRLAGDRRRPLLQGADRESIVRELLERRIPEYRKADHIVPTDGLMVEEVAERIIALLAAEKDGGE